MMNHTTMICRLTKDPESKNSNDKEVAKFSVACNRTKDKTDFYNCVAFDKVAQTVIKYLKKGSLVGLSGRIENNFYTNKDGKKVYDYVFTVNNVTFCESKKQEESDDDPFH